jgi:Tfp pilus assembly protein FimT
MNLSARRKFKAFTLLEMLVTVAIIMMISSLLAGGIIYLRNAIKLDNGLRDLKSQIQSAQNNARNSFVAFGGAAPSSLSSQKISIGWMMTLTNNSLGSEIYVTRQSVYFLPQSNTLPTTSYDFTKLSDDVSNLRQSISGKNFACLNGNFTLNGAVVTNFGRIKNANQLSTFTIQCSNTTDGDEYFSSTQTPPRIPQLLGMQLDDGSSVPSGTIKNCMSDPTSISIFFTLGYGEPALNTLDKDGCQVRIKSTGVTTSYRSFVIDPNTGGVETCASYCLSK